MTTSILATPITDATPAEIDAALANLQDRHAHLLSTVFNARRELDPTDHRFGRRPAADLDKLIANARADMALIEGQADAFDAEYQRRGGWTRYYLVEDGHLHYDVAMSRCSRIPSTTHYWMADLSGQPADDVIALAGTRVCTSCFPNAPVAARTTRPASRFHTPTEAERIAYEVEKARKAAARKAAEITTPDGQPLYTASSWRGPQVSDEELVRTEIAARRQLSAAATDVAWYGLGHPSAPGWVETAARMIAALAHRTGQTREEIAADTDTKIAKKIRRDGGEVLATLPPSTRK